MPDHDPTALATRTTAGAPARLVDDLPVGPEWQYEPKWDGFRCIAFRDGAHVELMSKAGKPLGRYFPELVELLLALRARRFILDGEIVVRTGDPGYGRHLDRGGDGVGCE